MIEDREVKTTAPLTPYLYIIYQTKFLSGIYVQLLFTYIHVLYKIPLTMYKTPLKLGQWHESNFHRYHHSPSTLLCVQSYLKIIVLLH